ncbi:MAG: hypothetical protein KGM42_16445 [Hyphomicrobiales bacterium]|nr:hypothetical protein [Hyphomicrobiales bacterium]
MTSARTDRVGAPASDVLFSDDTLRIEYFRTPGGDAKKLAFIFSSFGNRILGGGAAGASYLMEDGFDVVRFSTVANDWFQTMPEAVLDRVDEVARAGGYTWRAALGSSMGGYAAICFSARLRVDIVLAYGPQYRVSGWNDLRFAPVADKLIWKYLITSDSIGDHCRYCFIYDSKDFDCEHVQALRALIGADRVDDVALPYAGHTTMFFLHEVGRLQDVARAVLNGEKVSARDLRRDRRRSRQYLTTLSTALAPKHPRLSARVRALAGPSYEPHGLVRRALDAKAPPIAALAMKIEILRLRRMGFDAEFYRQINWDIEVAGADPYDHYVRHGWRQGRLTRFRKTR